MFFEILEKARKLSEKVLRCKRYNPKHIYHANEMKELERKITRLLSSSVLVDILADVNDVPFVLMLLHRYVVDERKGLPLSLKVLEQSVCSYRRKSKKP
ncbi:BnaC08g15980D [Brassica napus]|uniref:BnaC08g15980D protein n=1 Tax=Brassica napus TaxID=3708 RepID=A0A078IJI4_BRANA|nr:BnaC08g15980D [Brassica napus]